MAEIAAHDHIVHANFARLLAAVVFAAIVIGSLLVAGPQRTARVLGLQIVAHKAVAVGAEEARNNDGHGAERRLVDDCLVAMPISDELDHVGDSICTQLAVDAGDESGSRKIEDGPDRDRSAQGVTIPFAVAHAAIGFLGSLLEEPEQVVLERESLGRGFSGLVLIAAVAVLLDGSRNRPPAVEARRVGPGYENGRPGSVILLDVLKWGLHGVVPVAPRRKSPSSCEGATLFQESRHVFAKSGQSLNR